MLPGREVINAGICGYTISDQASCFAEKARHAAPDLTILQVCDNDLIELSALSRSQFAREGRGSFRPSEAERRYFRRLRELQAARKGR